MLRAVPLTLAEANQVVGALHRHHKPCTGHRFSIGVIDAEGTVRGVAIAGRAVARNTDQRMVLEVSRVATDGTRNACSLLLGACARAARAMGFTSIQTFTLPEEGGASLRGAGWQCVGEAGGGEWSSPTRARKPSQRPDIKAKWVKVLHPEVGRVELPEAAGLPDRQESLFGGAA